MLSGRQQALFGLAGHRVQVEVARGMRPEAGKPRRCSTLCSSEGLTFILELPEAQTASLLPVPRELQSWVRARPTVFCRPLLRNIYCPLAQGGLWENQSLKSNVLCKPGCSFIRKSSEAIHLMLSKLLGLPRGWLSSQETYILGGSGHKQAGK